MSKSNLKIALCQVSSEVGNIVANAEKIIRIYNETDADLIVFPELSLSGYSCKDLFFDKQFIAKITAAVAEITKVTNNKALLIGAPITKDNKLFNSALLIQNGEIKKQYNKRFLPNYGVFDEQRYFTSGDELSAVWEVNKHKIRVLICEDLWHDDMDLASQSEVCSITIAINSSPFSINKLHKRLEIAKNFVQKYKQGYLAYLNSVCADDHLIFEGGSMLIDANGDVLIEPRKWQEDIIIFDLNIQHKSKEYYIEKSDVLNLNDDAAKDIYYGIVLGLKEYAKYSNCNKFVLGLSGGIDSALVALIAADAFGSNNILTIAMPSKYSSENSLNDAIELAQQIGCEIITIPIIDIKKSLDNSLIEAIGKLTDDEITNENLQPRIRATILMAIANKQNRLLLCTSNKSESAVGYTTLYGDMTGAFAPIIDLYKTQVYSLTKWRNNNIPENFVGQNIIPKKNIIPISIIDKEPSAELKPNQKDSDSLLNYKILDPILYSLIELKNSCEDIAMSNNTSTAEVGKVKKMLFKNEFKRYQSPPGPKINHIMLNTDRRYPICSSGILT